MPRACERPGFNALMIFMLYPARGSTASGRLLRRLMNWCTSGLVLVRISSGVPCATIEPCSEHDHPRGDAKSARHIVRDNDRRHVASMGQFDRELIDNRRHDRVEPRRWLIAKKQFRIERECPRQSNSLLHSTADFIRLEVLKTRQADHLEVFVSRFLRFHREIYPCVEKVAAPRFRRP